MDFIEFLQSGSEGSYNRIKFDGRKFKKENSMGYDQEFEITSGDYIEDTRRSYTEYSLDKINNAYYGGNLEFRIKDSGGFTDYSIEIKNGYATLKKLDSTVYSYSTSSSSTSSNSSSPLSSNSSSSSSSNDDDDSGSFVLYLILALIVPFVIFIRSLKIIQDGDTYDYDKTNDIVFGSVAGLCFGIIITVFSSIKWIPIYFLGFGILYIVVHAINMLTLFLDSILGNFLYDEPKRVNIISIIFSILYVIAFSLVVTFIII